jgi:hypothetical protein
VQRVAGTVAPNCSNGEVGNGVGWGGEVLGHWGVLVLMDRIHVFFAALREGSVGLSHVELAAEGAMNDVHHIGGLAVEGALNDK